MSTQPLMHPLLPADLLRVAYGSRGKWLFLWLRGLVGPSKHSIPHLEYIIMPEHPGDLKVVGNSFEKTPRVTFGTAGDQND